MTAPPASSPPQFSHREVVVIIIGVLTGMSLAVLDATILGAALPKIAAEMNAAEDISWIVSIYLLISTAATPIYGKLSDIFGRRMMLKVALVIFIFASAFCALAGDLIQLVIARALQAVGGAGLIVMAHTTIADVTSPRERGRYQIYPSGMWFIGGLLGPVLGGFFVDYLTWRWIFWINLPIGALAFVIAHITLRKLPGGRSRRPRIDFLGAILIVGAITCGLLTATMAGAELAWTSPTLLALAVGAIVLTWLAVIQERRADEPLLPPRLFRSAVFVISNIGTALGAAQFFSIAVLAPAFLQLGYGVSATASGLMIFAFGASPPIMSTIAARIMSRTGRYRSLPLIGTATSTTALFGLALCGPQTPLWVHEILFFFVGAGAGFAGAPLMVCLQNALDPRDLGVGTASMTIFRNFGAALGVAVFSTAVISHMNGLTALGEALGPSPGAALLHAGSDAIASAPEALRAAVAEGIVGAFQIMFLAAGVLGVISLAVMYFLPELPLRTAVGLAARAERDSKSRPPTV